MGSPSYRLLCDARDALEPHQWTFNALLRHATSGYSYYEWEDELLLATEEVERLDEESDGSGFDQCAYDAAVERQVAAEGIVEALSALENMLADPNYECAVRVRNDLVDYFLPIETVLRSRGVRFDLHKFINASLADIAPLLENKNERP